LAGTDSEQTFVFDTEYKPSEATTSLVVGSTNIYISGMEASEEDKTRLEKELKEAASHIERLEKLLAGDFANKAPAALVQKERDKLAGYKETAEKIKAQLK
jgi:valyl-tRNA synthetase